MRNKQSDKLPLFLKCVKIVQKHQNCLEIFQKQNKNHGIPIHIGNAMQQGEKCLINYKKTLEAINIVLKRNQTLVDQLCQSQFKLDMANKKLEVQRKDIG